VPDNYRHDEIQDVLAAGPHDDETWFRLQAIGKKQSKHLNVSAEELATIRDTLYGADNPGTADDGPAAMPVNGQIIITLDGGSQIALMYGNVQVRSRLSDTWSLPLAQSAKPHEPGTWYMGEW
jgi:hypothetical protein